MAHKQQPGWQFKFTFGLSIVMFFLVIAYFVQSFHEMREIRPVSVAVERIKESRASSLTVQERSLTNEEAKATTDSQQ